ncbi:MAG TPA: hypothetical protein VEU30_14460 [Thermoanaerobaculia bacterium]|nr:hypothetical protein [Thermoanaerobaculia bacterium]
MRFAKWVFLLAAIYGVLALLPQYFVKPSADRPDFFYGFIGIAIAWQLAFFVIASDVTRYRPLMLVAVLEKWSFGIPAVILYSQGRIPQQMLLAGIGDLVLSVLFFIAWRRTG